MLSCSDNKGKKIDAVIFLPLLCEPPLFYEVSICTFSYMRPVFYGTNEK
jgi:hypothetical protein